jgi:hypothetical protein
MIIPLLRLLIAFAPVHVLVFAHKLLFKRLYGPALIIWGADRFKVDAYSQLPHFIKQYV